MRFSLLALAAAATAVSAQSSSVTAMDAPVATGNPAGAEYIANLPDKPTTSVRGSITGASAPDGKGVLFKVAISGLPDGGGPFMYHIHEKPVPADGNCTGTGAHLDPYKRGEVPECNASEKQQCQTGDLSGKFGNFTSSAGSFDYVDLYSSTNPTNPAFFGNLSVVVHSSNKTRLSCANFTLVAPGASVTASSGTALPTPSGIANNTLPSVTSAYEAPEPTQPEPSVAEASDAASTLNIAGAGIIAGAIALLL